MATHARPSVYPASAQSGFARSFVDHIQDRLGDAVILRYTLRLELLRAARQFGIGRFEANLLIAAVLEKRKNRCSTETETRREGSAVSTLAVFLLIQGAMALGAWWTIFR